MSTTCTDRVIGNILAGWRYDISGLAPEMRGDYDQHLAECAHCQSGGATLTRRLQWQTKTDGGAYLNWTFCAE